MAAGWIEKIGLRSRLLIIAQVERTIAAADTRWQFDAVLRAEISPEHLGRLFAELGLILFVHIVNGNFVARRITSSWFVRSKIDLMIRRFLSRGN